MYELVAYFFDKRDANPDDVLEAFRTYSLAEGDDLEAIERTKDVFQAVICDTLIAALGAASMIGDDFLKRETRDDYPDVHDEDVIVTLTILKNGRMVTEEY